MVLCDKHLGTKVTSVWALRRHLSVKSIQFWHYAGGPVCNPRIGSCRAGTPVYMAPEVFRREYGVQSDMWSLGMMLYHFISQRFPFW